jgi:hypothetical protein
MNPKSPSECWGFFVDNNIDLVRQHQVTNNDIRFYGSGCQFQDSAGRLIRDIFKKNFGQ